MLIKRYTQLISIYAIFSFTFCLANEPKVYSPENPNPFYENMWKMQEGIFAGSDYGWDAHTYREWIEKLTERAFNPPAGPHRKRAFDFFKQINGGLVPDTESDVLSSQTLNDLNTFVGGLDKTKFLASFTDRTVTQMGKLSMYTMLARPLKGIEAITELQKRQSIIDTFKNNKVLAHEVDKTLKGMKQPENIVINTFGQHENLNREVTEHNVYKLYGLDKLNGNEYALHLKNITDKGEELMGHAMTLFAAVALPLLGFGLLEKLTDNQTINEWANDLKGSGGTLYRYLLWFVKEPIIQSGVIVGSGVISGLRLGRSVQWTLDSFFGELCLQKWAIALASYVEGMKRLHTYVRANPLLSKNLVYFNHLDEFIRDVPSKTKELEKLFELFKTDTFKGQPSYSAFKGRVFLAIKLFAGLKKTFEGSLLAVGEIDAYHSLAVLMNEHEGKPGQYSYVNYIDAQEPVIELTDFWNPFVDPEKVATNSIILGGSQRRNIIVTGPNEGGKSTTLKAIAINLILAQSFGICAARNATITPFSKITTYLNTVDDIGLGNSLFKSEVLRAYDLLEMTKKLGPKEYSFVALDEMFNSTTAVEGSAAAYSVAQTLGSYQNNVCLLATHFPLLTELEKNTDAFTNYKVSVEVQKDGQILRTFKLEKGISNQHIAIDILQHQGFGNEIVRKAQELVANG